MTGESDEITKAPGAELMSGSFVVAGECRARLDKVGVDSYISKLTLEAKAMKKGEQSEMIRSLDKLVKICRYCVDSDWYYVVCTRNFSLMLRASETVLFPWWQQFLV